MEVLTTDEALKTLKGSSARPFHSDVLDTEEAIKILRAHSQVEKREPKVYTVSKPQEPRTYHRNADGLMTQVGAQPTAKQQKQAENAARLDALAGRTGAQKDPPAPIGRPQMQSYTSQREGVAMQLPQIDQWNANASMPAVKELAGKAVNMGTNILFPLKGMKQGVDLLTGKTQSTFDPEAERQALSQMGAVQRGVERVASGLNSIVETPAAALRYAGETAVQAGKNLAENFQKDGYGDRLSEAVYRKIKNQLTETAFDPVLLKYVSVPIGTPPDKVHEAYLKLQEEKGAEQAASAALKEITTDTPVDPNSAGTQMMRQTQERQAAAVEGLSPTGQFIGNTLASVGQNAMLMPFDAQRVELLRELGKRCPVYLLSNTNLPHRIRFRESFRERFGGSFDELFVRCFYSDELHLRKPDPEIYRSVARQIGTPPGKLLFIDDNAANVSAARGEGWQACHLTGGITVTDLFEL